MRILALLLVLASATPTHAQEGPAERRLVERVSKTSFNEALDSYHDLALIWQVVEGHGATAAERAQWLRHHSRCVNGDLTQDEALRRPGNCHWTRNLLPNGRRPRGFHDCHDEDGDGEIDIAPGHTAEHRCDGSWPRVRPRWLAHLERVRAFVRGTDTYRPCAETPHTWDGVRYGRERVGRGRRRILACEPPYVERGEGLNNFAVRYDAS